MKTAVTVLQEMMVKLNQTPEYECVSQTGPHHSATFEYRCAARGHEVRATARSKKEAKQEAARLMLLALGSPGGGPPAPAAGEPAAGAHSSVALLRDLCEEYRLPSAEYELVGDTGPPHMRQFTVRVALRGHERHATASTKKAARQLAAHQLYTYLRENLGRLTKDFVEEEALVRAHERAMQRVVEAREPGAWRPDLGLPLSAAHTSLHVHVGTSPPPRRAPRRVVAHSPWDRFLTHKYGLCAEEEQREAARRALEAAGEGDAAVEEAVAAAAGALGLAVRLAELPAEPGPLALLELTPTLPEIALADRSRAQVYSRAARYLLMALSSPAPGLPAAPASDCKAEPGSTAGLGVVDK